jgi:hypothetical protein
MHTVWVRLNAVVFFGLTVLLVLSLMAALSKVGHTYRSRPGMSVLFGRLFFCCWRWRCGCCWHVYLQSASWFDDSAGFQ